jgi:hypothetical protein
MEDCTIISCLSIDENPIPDYNAKKGICDGCGDVVWVGVKSIELRRRNKKADFIQMCRKCVIEFTEEEANHKDRIDPLQVIIKNLNPDGK